MGSEGVEPSSIALEATILKPLNYEPLTNFWNFI